MVTQVRLTLQKRYLATVVLALGFLLISIAGDTIASRMAESALAQQPIPPPDELSFHQYLPIVFGGSLTLPFYGMQFVPDSDFGTVSALGAEVVIWSFGHGDTPESWLAILDEAQAQGIEVIAVLVPEGWSWDGTAWQIDEQAELFIQTVAEHPALFAVYSLEEPYWDEDEQDLGYTTAEQQLLYSAIKAIADVPIYSDVDSMAFWTAYSPETTFTDGVCDYCGTGHYPCLPDGSYDRDGFIEWLSADLATIRELAPNSKLVWNMQAFAQEGTYRMPTADEMRDQAAIVYSMDVDGALWYCWWFGPLYSDFLSNHPELYPVVREIYQEYVLPAKP